MTKQQLMKNKIHRVSEWFLIFVTEEYLTSSAYATEGTGALAGDLVLFCGILDA